MFLPGLPWQHVNQISGAVIRFFWLESFFLLAHRKIFRFLSSLFTASMVLLHFLPDSGECSRMDLPHRSLDSSSVPDYADAIGS
jgi:hypothetical protein